MPKGYAFSREIKQLMFNVIEFVENEMIRWYRCTISMIVSNPCWASRWPRSEDWEERWGKKKIRIVNEQKKVDKAKQEDENQELEMTRCFRRARSSSTTTNVYNIEILRWAFPLQKMLRLYKSICRLSIKHCMLNPIELAWASMNAYVRDNPCPRFFIITVG